MVATPAAVSRLPDGGRFVALDSWRGLAALGVAAYHLEGGGILFDGPPVTNMNSFVDFFFVLSGFVLAAAYGERLAQGFSIGRYMLLRLGRVYPLHLVMVLAYVGLELLFLVAGNAGWALREPFTGTRDPMLIVTSLLMIGPWFDPPLDTYNMQSWSIAVEIWLYLGLALSVRFAGRLGWWLLPVASLAAIAAMSLPDWPANYFPYQIMRGVAGFGLGIAIWRIRAGSWADLRVLSAISVSFAELAAVALVIVVLTWVPYGQFTFLAKELTFALIVLIFAADRGIVSRLLRTRPFVWLGVLSYSFYMVHAMVLGRLADALRFAGLGKLIVDGDSFVRSIDADPWLASLLGIGMIAACVPVAWLAWRFVEWPARDWSRRRAAEMGVAREETVAPTI